MRATAVFILLGALLANRTARADGFPGGAVDRPRPPSAPFSTPVPSTTWYGWQILAVDAASVVTLTASLERMRTNGADTLTTAFTYGGLGSFVLGGPVIHAVHLRWETAAEDIALRLGLPFVTSLIGAGIGSALAPSAPACNPGAPGLQSLGCSLQAIHDSAPILVGAAAGAGAGGLAASVIDALLLSRAAATAPPSVGPRSMLAWSPTVLVRAEGGASVGVVGSF